MESGFWDPLDGSEDGSVAAVDSADLCALWDLFGEVRARNADHKVAIGIAGFERACSPGASVRSVYYRAAMPLLCERRGPTLTLAARWPARRGGFPSCSHFSHEENASRNR
jgi:hypothetical protein